MIIQGHSHAAVKLVPMHAHAKPVVVVQAACLAHALVHLAPLYRCIRAGTGQ